MSRIKKVCNILKGKKKIEDSSFLRNQSEFSRPSYSQDGEDVVLMSFYEDKPGYKGFYIDIGALHPLRFSNTQLFYENGWCGINIDATPGSMNEFRELRPKDINLECGISKSGKELTFFRFKEPALNSFNEEISTERIAKGWELAEKQKVKTFNINLILEENLPKGKKIDLMSIDVEGLEFEILKSLDWVKYSPDFLLLEDLMSADKDIVECGGSPIYKFLKGAGYLIVGKTKRTLVFKKNV